MTQEIAPGVFVATETTGANYGLIRTSVGAVLVDGPWIPSQAQAWHSEVEALSPLGVAYMVNTDYHLDHVLGNCFMPPALTIAHETAWRYLRALDREVVSQRALEQGRDLIGNLAAQLAKVRVVTPEVTVGRLMVLWCGDRHIEIHHLGGHTAATLGVYVPDQRLLFSGDLIVNGRHPHMADANSRQWLESLDRVRAMGVKLIVPGHGQPGGPEIIDRLYAYLSGFRCRVEECFRDGLTRRETVERVKPVDAFPITSGDEEHLRRVLRSSVERVYDEIKKEAIGSRPRSQG